MTTADLKIKFMRDILASTEATKLIDAYGEYAEYPDDMINRNIFTWWQFKADVLQEAKVLVGMKIDFPRTSTNPVCKDYRLSVLILCHKNLMGMKGRTGNRLDLLSDELERLWVGDRTGIDARLNLVSNTEDTFNDDYYCRTLVFKSYTDNNMVNGVKRNA